MTMADLSVYECNKRESSLDRPIRQGLLSFLVLSFFSLPVRLLWYSHALATWLCAGIFTALCMSQFRLYH